MRERPILFKGEMVRAILNGSKTQTRRACSYQNFRVEDNIKHPQCGSDLRMLMADHKNAGRVVVGDPDHAIENVLSFLGCPYGKVGDQLWVRETHAYVCGEARGRKTYSSEECSVHFEDQESDDFTVRYAADGEGISWEPQRWRPSLHMHRWASRINLEITDIRVQLLKNISEADAMAEGIEKSDNPHIQSWPFLGTLHPIKGTPKVFATGVRAFQDLWDSLANEKTNWAANPWVWVIEFKRVMP